MLSRPGDLWAVHVFPGKGAREPMDAWSENEHPQVCTLCSTNVTHTASGPRRMVPVLSIDKPKTVLAPKQ